MSEVEVTQADRDAAASGYYAWCSGNPTIPNRMVEGSADDHSMIQAFARHRIAAEEGKAELVRALADSERELTRSTALLEHISSTPGYGSDQNSEAELLDHVSCGNAVLGKARAALARVRGEG